MSGETGERVQIFTEGSFTKGDLTWGWQCFLCAEEETGFGSATTAGQGRDNHAALGCAASGGCSCGHAPHLHDPEAVPALCMACGDDSRCGSESS